MPLTSAERTKKWRQGKLDSCETENEKTSLKIKWNEQSKDSKRRKRETKRKSVENRVIPAPTANTLRQRRFRNKKRKEQEEEPENEETMGQLAIDQGKKDEALWENAYTQLHGELPIY